MRKGREGCEDGCEGCVRGVMGMCLMGPSVKQLTMVYFSPPPPPPPYNDKIGLLRQWFLSEAV